ncbi:MAG: DUF4363 family protein [Oscillospiraceae bacterium]|nr:DUF4363 family protein [Oscillospiraceae bacterium]
MKSEFIAVFIIAALLALALININHIETKTLALTEEIELAEKQYNVGDIEGAVFCVEDSLNAWLSWDSYSHIMLRHSEVDVITDTYFDLLSELEGEAEVSQASFEKLKEALASIADKERVSLKSIL